MKFYVPVAIVFALFLATRLTNKSTFDWFKIVFNTKLLPCIMCVQYIAGYSLHRGDTMSTSGGIMSTSGNVQYMEGIS